MIIKLNVKAKKEAQQIRTNKYHKLGIKVNIQNRTKQINKNHQNISKD